MLTSVVGGAEPAIAGHKNDAVVDNPSPGPAPGMRFDMMFGQIHSPASQVVIMRDDAVAVATTGTLGTTVPASDTSRIVTLGGEHRAVAFVSGTNNIAGLPAQGLLQEWSLEHPDPLRTIGEYPRSFARFLGQHCPLLDPRRQDGLAVTLIEERLEHLALLVADMFAGVPSGVDINAEVHDIIARLASRPVYEEVPYPAVNDFLARFASQIADTFDMALDDAFSGEFTAACDLHPALRPATDALLFTVPPLVLTRHLSTAYRCTITFVGFGAGDKYPSLHEVTTLGSFGGGLLHAFAEGSGIASAAEAPVLETLEGWGAAEAFLMGYDHSVASGMLAETRGIVAATLRSLRQGHGIPTDVSESCEADAIVAEGIATRLQSTLDDVSFRGIELPTLTALQTMSADNLGVITGSLATAQTLRKSDPDWPGQISLRPQIAVVHRDRGVQRIQ